MMKYPNILVFFERGSHWASAALSGTERDSSLFYNSELLLFFFWSNRIIMNKWKKSIATNIQPHTRTQMFLTSLFPPNFSLDDSMKEREKQMNINCVGREK